MAGVAHALGTTCRRDATEQDLVSVKNGILKLKDVRDERNEWVMRTRERLG